MRRHDNHAPPPTFGSQEILQEIDAVTVQHAIGLVDQQELRFQQLPFRDRQPTFHAAGKCRHILFGAIPKAYLPEGSVDLAVRLALFVKRGEEMEIFTNREIFVKMLSGREKSDGRTLDRGAPLKPKPIEYDFSHAGRNETGKEFEKCCFAGAVGPQKSDDFPRVQVNAEILKRPQQSIGFGELMNGQVQCVSFPEPKMSNRRKVVVRI